MKTWRIKSFGKNLHISENTGQLKSKQNRQDKNNRVQQDWSTLDQENMELRSLSDTSSEEIKNLKVQLAEAEAGVARSSVNWLAPIKSYLTRHLLHLSNDEFNANLAHILTFSITSVVEKGLRMGIVRSAPSAPAPTTSPPSGESFGWTSASKGSEAAELAPNVPSSLA
nr:hypothetical protein [Tanacetum cinerariifolium]